MAPTDWTTSSTFRLPNYLGDLSFANGNALFSETEVSHMADVKQVMLITTLAGLIAAVACVVLMILLYRMRKGAIARSLFAGAVWFTAAMIVLAIVAAFGWGSILRRIPPDLLCRWHLDLLHNRYSDPAVSRPILD